MRELRSYNYRVVRAEGDSDSPPVLVSVAPPWETLSVDLGGFREKFSRGAFDLEEADVLATFEHRNELLLGRTPTTLKLSDTEDGLQYEVELPDTQLARDLAVMIDRGDISGSSFEFSVADETWSEEGEEEMPVRTVTRARLFQVGPVTTPAYRETDVALRSLEGWRKGQGSPLAHYRHRARLMQIGR